MNGEPLQDSTVAAPFTVELADPGGVEDGVKFLLDNAYLGEDKTAPYQWTVTTEPGDHEIKVRWNDLAGDRQTAEATFTATSDTSPPVPDEPPGPALTDLDLSTANRRTPADGLYDWSKAGYREGAGLPTEAELTSDTNCLLTPETLESTYNVIPDDEDNDGAGIQQAIDHVRENCSPAARYTKLSRIELPAGRLLVDAQIKVDADYMILTGAGSDPETGTEIVFTPNADTRYDALTEGDADWDEDGMTWGDAKGGWIWPGRGLFHVASREVAAKYRADAPEPDPENYDNAPANRRDLFEGTVNAHWISGATLRAMPGETAYAGKTGQTKVYLNSETTDAIMDGFKVGGYVNIRAANSVKFYGEMSVPADHSSLKNLHMRQQIFGITEVDTTNKVITLDKPLEFDVPVDSTSDGSAVIDERVYTSKAAPLVTRWWASASRTCTSLRRHPKARRPRTPSRTTATSTLRARCTASS
ncbi:hypothetical protein BJF79_33870 [Actinomadura sp. CNU-125]|uniref:Ig-like domain-containing protein n=1 Tax=Actinomadura sp. CNU-125 TaxID=1904961 RepID=UPI00095CFF70|nr:Ig-like domain-containing protein [Actinomadura sp. CNU-125]OLT34044.1 hypothetical protein BJF79_33870 [Actinomadura sp. CNU-125]